jgi:flagellin
VTASNGLSFGTPVAGTDAVTAGQPTSLTLGSGELSINGTDITGTFADVQALADGINAAGIQGVSAYKGDDGSLVVQSNGTAASGDSITFGGSSALATAFGTTAYADTNSLADTDGSGDVMNVKTIAGANDSINRIDAALASVSSIDSQLGAMQNRFNSAITSAQAVSQNLSASRSRIQDADFAAETAAMSQAQILQQAGVSMLAQANAQPQLVLKLLQ